MSQRDYTAFLKLDSNGRLVIVTNKITITGLTRNEGAYIYEPGHSFNGDFTHEFDFQTGAVIAPSGASIIGIWSIANDIDDIQGLQDAGKSFLRLEIQKGVGTEQLYLIERDGSSGYVDFVPSLTYSGKFYNRVKRTEADGPFGTIYCTPFTDVNRTIPFDVLAVPLHTSKKDYNKVYAVHSRNTGTTQSIDAIIENLNFIINTTTVGVVTAVDGGNQTINVAVPYTDDDNNDSTYTVDYKLSSESPWTNWVTEAPNTPSPYLTTITGLIGEETYDVRVTYVDPDGVTGTNPQIIADILVRQLTPLPPRRDLIFDNERRDLELDNSRRDLEFDNERRDLKA